MATTEFAGDGPPDDPSWARHFWLGYIVVLAFFAAYIRGCT